MPVVPAAFEDPGRPERTASGLVAAVEYCGRRAARLRLLLWNESSRDSHSRPRACFRVEAVAEICLQARCLHGALSARAPILPRCQQVPAQATERTRTDPQAERVTAP